MLEVIQRRSSQQSRRIDLDRIGEGLHLSALQQQVWQAFADIFCEASEAIETADAVAESIGASSLTEKIDAQSCCLVARLRAMNRLRDAVEGLHYSLTPSQRSSADRYLAVACRALGCTHSPAH